VRAKLAAGQPRRSEETLTLLFGGNGEQRRLQSGHGVTGLLISPTNFPVGYATIRRIEIFLSVIFLTVPCCQFRVTGAGVAELKRVLPPLKIDK
jgi:hypothetical protein